MHASNKALLIPRIVNVSTSIAGPLRGMIVYDSSNNKLSYYNGSSWRQLDEGGNLNIYNQNGSLSGSRTVNCNGNILKFENIGRGYDGMGILFHSNEDVWTEWKNLKSSSRIAILTASGGRLIYGSM